MCYTKYSFWPTDTDNFLWYWQSFCVMIAVNSPEEVRYGARRFYPDKLEIKFLILYVAARLIEPVPFEAMQELTMCDDGIDFFDFSECLSNLVESQHLTLSDDGLYAITEKGLHNGAICESSLPLLCAPARRQEHHDLQPEAQAPRADPVRHRAAPQRDLHGHARVQRRREPAHLEDGTDGSQGGHGQGPRRALPEKIPSSSTPAF